MAVGNRLDHQVVAEITGQPLDLLQNSSHLQQMGELLIRDGLTGLYNRTYVSHRLAIEFQAVRDSSRPIAMIMLDVDGFKQVNDAFGHPAGDAVLVEVARIIKRLSVRLKVDGFAARHGGDEFLIVLLGLDGSAAEQWANLLHATLEQAAVDFGTAGRKRGIPVSIGVAAWPADAGTTPALYEAADQAMYYAKHRKGGVTQFAEIQRVLLTPVPESFAGHLPSGTVTLLVARLAMERAPGGIPLSPDTLVRFHRRACEWIDRLGGKLFYQAFQAGELRAAFLDASMAAKAGHALLHVLSAGSENAIGPTLLCIALHTGEIIPRKSQSEGPAVQHCVWLAAAAHPGQIVLSESTAIRIGDALPEEITMSPCGVHRFGDLQRAEPIYQLVQPDIAAEFPPLVSLDAVPNNLPTQLTPLIGRKQVLTELACHVETARLVTLVGTGGTGKTRLALHVAAAISAQFPNGVWVVELASLSDPELVMEVIATSAGVSVSPGQSILASLIESLRSKRTLLVIDNCEHLVAACGTAITELLGACPGLHILTTSRSPLALPGEVLYRVPSLSLPVRGSEDLSSLHESEAVELFVDRARASWPWFQLSKENVLTIASICWRLDGIPLALELAAARVQVLSVTGLLDRLDDLFRVLHVGNQTALPRHQTLRALVGWSYDLLTEPEQLLWRRLSVFADSFSVEAAELLCESAGHDVLNLLTELVDKSILTAQEVGEQKRFRMLETIRQFGADKLLQSGDEAAVRDRHLRWCVRTADDARRSMTGDDTAGTLERLSHDHENFRTALQWSRSRQELAEDGLQLAVALSNYWVNKAHYREAQQHTMALLALLPDDTELTARALLALGRYAWMQADYEGAKRAFTKAAATYRALGHVKGVGQSLNNLANVAQTQGEIDLARSLYEEALAIAIEVGELPSVARTLDNLGLNAFHRGDYAQTRSFWEKAVSLKRQVGDTLDLPATLCNLGILAYNENRYEEANTFYGESLALAQKLGDLDAKAVVLYNMAAILTESGQYEKALATATQSLDLYRSMGNKAGVASALHQLGLCMVSVGQLELTETYETESLALRREIGDRPGIASSLVVLSRVARARQQYEVAAPLLAESLALRQKLKAKQGIASTLYYQAILAADLSQYDRADELFKKSSALQIDLGDKRALFHSLWRMATVALAQCRLDDAARLQQAVKALWSVQRVHIHPCDQPEYEQYLADMRRQLGERTSVQAY